MRVVPGIWAGSASPTSSRIDAVSNRGVDDARVPERATRRRRSGYCVHRRRRHMLTRERETRYQDFTPPPRVLVFATTEPQRFSRPPRRC